MKLKPIKAVGFFFFPFKPRLDKQTEKGFQLQGVGVPSAQLTELVQPSTGEDAVTNRNRAKTTI